MDRNKSTRHRYSPPTSKSTSNKQIKSNNTSNRKSRSRSRSPLKSSRHHQPTTRPKQRSPRSRSGTRRRRSSSSYSSSSNDHSSSSRSGSASSSYSSSSNSSSVYSSYQSGGSRSSSKGDGSSSSSHSSSSSSYKRSSPVEKKSKTSSRHVSTHKQNDTKLSTTQQPKLSIYVSNLTRNMLKGHIEEIFSEYGSIQNIDFPTDELRHFTKGYVYIKYNQEQSVQKSLKYMNGGCIDGQEVTVQVCKLNTSTSNSKKIRSPTKLKSSRKT